MELTKEVLKQYCKLRGEIIDLQERIAKTEQRLQKIEEEGEVSDIVTGSRRDGTIGTIKVTGFPEPEYEKATDRLKKRIDKLRVLEDEQQEAVRAAEDFISAIPTSDLRMIFRLYYIDDMSWAKVALRMNERFPKKRIKYTEDNCRMRHNRYLEKVK